MARAARRRRQQRRERTTAAVFNSHLRLRDAGQLENDLARNYAPDALLLTHEGMYRGHAGVRQAAKVLGRHVPDGKYRYTNKHVVDGYAYLEWRAKGPRGQRCFGWDGFVIRRGRIIAQMIYFRCAK